MFYTWIYRIVMNVTIDWLRKKQVKGAGAEFDDAIAIARRSIPPRARCRKPTRFRTNGWSTAEIRGRIDAAIAQLSPEHRAVILMKEIEDMQYHEIAESLGCSIGTVMSRFFTRAKNCRIC